MRKKLLLTMLLVSVLFSVSFVGVVSASPTSVRMGFLWDSSLGPGSIVTLDFTVDDVTNLWGYQFELSFDPTVLYGLYCVDGPFLSSAGGTVLIAPGPGFDNTNGKMGLFGAALYPKANFPTGGGVLASVTFMVIGYGYSWIELGENTGLADPTGRWIVHGAGGPGFFSNVGVPPELYIRRRGAFGVSGIIEEWQTGYVGQEQTFYSKVLNYGHGSATVKVKYVIQCSPYDVVTAWTGEAELGPVYLEGNKWIPTEAEVSASFMPPGPGKYHCYGIIYFLLEGVWYPYYETGLEGEGISRDTNVAFKVYPA